MNKALFPDGVLTWGEARDLDYTPEPAKEEFHITTEDEADWYLSKVHALQAEEALLRATGEAKIKRVVNERLQLEHRFSESLEHWARQNITGKVKSIILDHGTVQLRKVSGGLKITDKEAALKFAEEAREMGCLRRSYSLDLKAYERLAKDWMESSGELAPGVEMVEEHDAFSIRFPKKGEDAE